MKKNSVKNIRVNSEVQREMSQIIREDLKDPRIDPMTSVMSVYWEMMRRRRRPWRA